MKEIYQASASGTVAAVGVLFLTKSGKVYLIGAGPGDPKLITLRGVECIQRADVVIYDYLANDQLLRHARRGVEIVYAGKRKGGPVDFSGESIGS